MAKKMNEINKFIVMVKSNATINNGFFDMLYREESNIAKVVSLDASLVNTAIATSEVELKLDNVEKETAARIINDVVSHNDVFNKKTLEERSCAFLSTAYNFSTTNPDFAALIESVANMEFLADLKKSSGNQNNFFKFATWLVCRSVLIDIIKSTVENPSKDEVVASSSLNTETKKSSKPVPSSSKKEEDPKPEKSEKTESTKETVIPDGPNQDLWNEAFNLISLKDEFKEFKSVIGLKMVRDETIETLCSYEVDDAGFIQDDFIERVKNEVASNENGDRIAKIADAITEEYRAKYAPFSIKFTVGDNISLVDVMRCVVAHILIKDNIDLIGTAPAYKNIMDKIQDKVYGYLDMCVTASSVFKRAFLEKVIDASITDEKPYIVIIGIIGEMVARGDELVDEEYAKLAKLSCLKDYDKLVRDYVWKTSRETFVNDSYDAGVVGRMERFILGSF